VASEGSTVVKGRMWIGSLVLLLPLVTACSGTAQHSAAPLSCRAASPTLKSSKMPTLGKLTAELSFNGGGNGFVFTPPPTNARPIVSARQAWKAVLPLGPGNYQFILADRSNYNPYPGTVLVWVLMGTHVPSVIAPPHAVRSSCTYLDRVIAVNATSGAVDLEETFSPSSPEVPRVLTCRRQSPASGGPSCRWRRAKWPWGVGR
jgi:hypothetical protein